MTVRPVAREELDVVARHLHERPREKHVERLDAQERGEGVYLVAWRGATPVGHVLVRWADRAGYPGLEDVYVLPSERNQGFGTTLLSAAEQLCRGRGFERLGLGVAVDNVDARRLYARCGYSDAGLAPYVLRWDSGYEETCTYLVKKLNARR